MSDLKDPLGVRDVVRKIQRLEALVPTSKKTADRAELVKIRSAIQDVMKSLEGLNLVFEDGIPQCGLASQMFSAAQAFVRGEGVQLDDSGFLVLGDLATEIADELYKYASSEG